MQIASLSMVPSYGAPYQGTILNEAMPSRLKELRVTNKQCQVDEQLNTCHSSRMLPLCELVQYSQEINARKEVSPAIELIVTGFLQTTQL